MRKSTKTIGWTGVLMAAGMLAFALLGPLIIPHDAYEQAGPSFQSPGAAHWLGTNDMGQDILAELAVGARTSLFIGITTAIIATSIGGTIGVLSGYLGGWFETLVMRIIDIVLTLPFLPLMLVIAVYIGPGAWTQIFVITLVMWAGKARQIRSQTLAVKHAGPVLAAKSMGAGHVYLFRKHIFPGVFPLFIPQFVGAVNAAILLESSLSFLGMGDPMMKSWGSILYYANSRSAFLTESWVWWIIPPGLCIVLVVLAFSFIGYYLEEKVNPRLSAYVPATRRPKQKLLPAGKEAAGAVLSIRDMTVAYPKNGHYIPVVSNVSLEVARGEVLGIVGESGSGKTTVVSAIIQQLKEPAKLQVGGILFDGQDLQRSSDEEIRQVRGKRIGYISQAAMNALNPVIKIEKQLAEAVLAHQRVPAAELSRRVDEALIQVGLEPRWRSAYPHELSGGMKQRVIIAMALINRPEFIIADEPTTGLDVIVQVEIIELLQRLQRELNLSMIFISHDLPAVLKLADRLVIMKYGHIVDEGDSAELAAQSVHPYTRRLIDAIPRLGPKRGEAVLSK